MRWQSAWPVDGRFSDGMVLGAADLELMLFGQAENWGSSAAYASRADKGGSDVKLSVVVAEVMFAGKLNCWRGRMLIMPDGGRGVFR